MQELKLNKTTRHQIKVMVAFETKQPKSNENLDENNGTFIIHPLKGGATVYHNKELSNKCEEMTY